MEENSPQQPKQPMHTLVKVSLDVVDLEETLLSQGSAHRVLRVRKEPDEADEGASDAKSAKAFVFHTEPIRRNARAQVSVESTPSILPEESIVAISSGHHIKFKVVLVARNQTVLMDDNDSATTPPQAYPVKGYAPIFPCQITTDATSYQFLVLIEGKRTKREIRTTFTMVEDVTLQEIPNAFKTKGDQPRTVNAHTSIVTTGMYRKAHSESFGFCRTSCDIYSCSSVSLLNQHASRGLVRIRAYITVGTSAPITLYSPPFWVVSKRFNSIDIFGLDTTNPQMQFLLMPHDIEKRIAPRETALGGATPSDEETRQKRQGQEGSLKRFNRTINLYFARIYEQVDHQSLVIPMDKAATESIQNENPESVLEEPKKIMSPDALSSLK